MSVAESLPRHAGAPGRRHPNLGLMPKVLLVFVPAFLVLLVTTTVPLIYLAWTSVNRVDLTSPWIKGGSRT